MGCSGCLAILICWFIGATLLATADSYRAPADEPARWALQAVGWGLIVGGPILSLINRPRSGRSLEYDCDFYTKVVGVTFLNEDGSRRQKIIQKCRLGERLYLRPKLAADIDGVGIAVERWSGQQIGWLSREWAASTIRELELGRKFVVKISSLTGGRGKNRGVNIAVWRK